VMDNEPRGVGRSCGPIDATVCGSWKVTFSAAVMIQPDSGPICILGAEALNHKCWEFLIAGAEQGLEAGQIGLRLVLKGARQTTYNREWFIGTTCIADGRSGCFKPQFFSSFIFDFKICCRILHGEYICAFCIMIWCTG
jgi:hypothetical protein